MYTDKIVVGQVVNNYKEMCNLFNEKVRTNTKDKTPQIKEWSRYFNFIKDNYKFIITEIYDIPLEKDDDKRTGGKFIPQYKVDKKYNRCGGVYKITLDNKIYIGSTVGFRRRFTQHYNNVNNYHLKTYDLLQNGGIFEIVWLSEDNDEQLIRKKEEEYIQYYSEHEDYIIINYIGVECNTKIKNLDNICKTDDIDKINEMIKDNRITKITNKYVYFEKLTNLET